MRIDELADSVTLYIAAVWDLINEAILPGCFMLPPRVHWRERRAAAVAGTHRAAGGGWPAASTSVSGGAVSAPTATTTAFATEVPTALP